MYLRGLVGALMHIWAAGAAEDSPCPMVLGASPSAVQLQPRCPLQQNMYF